MSKLIRKLLNEPTWLEKHMGSGAYWAAAAKIEKEREKMLASNPQGYVDKEISSAIKYLNQGNYLAARDIISILRRLAKERNLTLPEDIDKFHRRILIEGAYGYYREYLQNPKDDLDRNMSQYFAEEGGLSIADIERRKGVISEEDVNSIIETEPEGCLGGLSRMFWKKERKG